MCLTVYIASGVPLPSADSANLFVRPIQESEWPVVQHFSKPHVYFIGAFTGCACGFRPPGDEGDEARDRTLSEFLQFLDAHAPNEPSELFVSWAGNEKRPAEYSLAFGRSELATRTDWCEEQTLVALAG